MTDDRFLAGAAGAVRPMRNRTLTVCTSTLNERALELVARRLDERVKAKGWAPVRARRGI